MITQLIDCIPKFSEAQRIVAYLDGLPPSLRSPALAPGASVGDASRQAKVNALRELQVRAGHLKVCFAKEL